MENGGRTRKVVRGNESCLPWIDDPDPAMDEVIDVASGNGRAMDVGYGGNLSIRMRNRSAHSASASENLGTHPGRLSVEGENMMNKILTEHCVSVGLHLVPAAPFSD